MKRGYSHERPRFCFNIKDANAKQNRMFLTMGGMDLIKT